MCENYIHIKKNKGALLHMKEYGFLFGAGAEASFCNTGKDFAKFIMNVHMGEDIKKIDQIIEEHYSNVLNNIREDIPANWYPEYSISRREDDFYRNLLNCDKKKKMCDKFFLGDPLEDTTDFSITEHDELLKHAESITNYVGVLEKHFHSMITPSVLGGESFWEVVNAYTRAFINISISIRGISLQNTSEITKILEDPKKNYQEICGSIKERISNNEENYYSIIAKFFKNPKVITANYTPIYDIVMQAKYPDINELQVAKIHGSLDLFESSFYLQVMNVNDINFKNKYSNDINFPYLFIQSGIKPIIEYHQLQEYSKMLSFLNNIDTLIILGYKCNSDDNHINSLLQHFLLKKKENKIVYFYYPDDSKNNEPDILLKRIRIPLHHFESIKKDQLKIYELSQDNSFETFEKALDEIIKR